MFEIDSKIIERLSNQHVARYENRIRSGLAGHPNIRVGECRAFRKLWQGIRSKGEWSKLDKLERLEVLDALDDEESGA